MWSPDPEQNRIQQQQTELLRRTQRDSRDALYQQRIDTTPYMYKRNDVSNMLGMAGDVIGQNVNPLAGQALKMLGENPDIIASGANTLGNILGGENTAAGRMLHGFVQSYNDDQEAAGNRALEAYTRKIIGAYMTDNRNANPNKVKWRILRNIKKGRNPYYKVNGRIRPELVNMSEVNFSFQKQLRKALESGNTQMIAYLMGRHTGRSRTTKDGQFLPRDDEKAKKGRESANKVVREFNAKAYYKDIDRINSATHTKKYKDIRGKALNEVVNERVKPTIPTTNTSSQASQKSKITLDDIKKRLPGALKHTFLTGVNTGRKRDYAYNLGSRGLEGGLLGTGTGALIGKAVEVSKIKKAIRESNEKHSKGALNKMLNTFDKTRLQRKAKEARDYVKSKGYVKDYAIKGGLIGELAGVGTGLAETAIKHHLSKKNSKP